MRFLRVRSHHRPARRLCALITGLHGVCAHRRIEFHLGDVFMLDVSGMKSMEDYKKTLNVKQRWNFKDRQKK